MDLPSPLDFAKSAALRIEGLLELGIGHAAPWFIVFRSEQPPGAIIIYHSPAGNSVGYTQDSTAVGSFITEALRALEAFTL